MTCWTRTAQHHSQEGTSCGVNSDSASEWMRIVCVHSSVQSYDTRRSVSSPQRRAFASVCTLHCGVSQASLADAKRHGLGQGERGAGGLGWRTGWKREALLWALGGKVPREEESPGCPLHLSGLSDLHFPVLPIDPQVTSQPRGP